MHTLTKSDRISFLFVLALFLVVFSAGLGTPLVTVLFSVLFLELTEKVTKSKWLSIVVFVVANCVAFYGFVFFVRQALHTLPRVLEESLPSIISYAQQHGIDFLTTYEDVESLKQLLVQTIKEQLGEVAKYATVATKEFVIMLISLVVASSLFLDSQLDLDRERHAKRNNLYSALCESISKRFATLFASFATVMGAQLLISCINSLATAIFVISIGLPHAFLVIVVTFLCGLLPIIGNLISNTIIFGISATISVKLAIAALGFLVVLHKFEYFLNSKIIGSRIRNPMWLTLLALVIGEKLGGIPGMIFAPVILNYIKLETSKIELPTHQSSL